MREMTENELSSISGGVPLYFVVGVVLTAIAISDGINDFISGYNAAMND